MDHNSIHGFGRDNMSSLRKHVRINRNLDLQFRERFHKLEQLIKRTVTFMDLSLDNHVRSLTTASNLNKVNILTPQHMHKDSLKSCL